MNIYDYIILGLLLAAVAAAIVAMVRRRKKGRCISCSGDCACCPYKKNKD